MRFTVLAVAGGLLLGLAAGGRPTDAARAAPRWWGLLLVGVALQWAPELAGTGEGAAVVLVGLSYGCLAAFAVANLGLAGMPVVLVGLALNAAVILANGGMPVRAEAVVAAGIAEADEVTTLDFGAKRHLEDGSDRFTVLADIIPVPGLGEVLSFGDLVLSLGVADVVFRLLVPAGRRRRARRRPSPPTPRPIAAREPNPQATAPATAPAEVDLVAAEAQPTGTLDHAAT